jgi:ATP-dependent Clp protease adaptor protein ClpS
MENSSNSDSPPPSVAPASPESVATLPPPKPTPTRPILDQLPPFRVLLHNDPINDLGFVIDSIVELTPLDKVRATEVSLEADKSGVALLLVTHQERAELYRDQFTSKKLTVTIEPAT